MNFKKSEIELLNEAIEIKLSKSADDKEKRAAEIWKEIKIALESYGMIDND